MRSVLIFLTLFVLTQGHDLACQFSSKYTSSDLESPQIRETFLREYLYWESIFLRELGVDQSTGLAINGYQIHLKTGMPEGEREKTASFEQEAIHLALLAKVLDKELHSDIFYSEEEALSLLSQKLSFYELHLDSILASSVSQIQLGIQNPVTFQKKEGEISNLFWAVFALVQVLEERYPEKDNFVSRWKGVEKILEAEVLGKAKEGREEQMDEFWNYYFMPQFNSEEKLSELYTSQYSKFLTFRSQFSPDSQTLESFFSPQTVSSLFRVDKPSATKYLHFILSREGGQSRFGATSESECSSFCSLNWQSKLTPVISILGSLSDTILTRIRDGSKVSRDRFQPETDFVTVPESAPRFREAFVSCRAQTYPEEFVWGVATASYQIEGAWNADGKGMNIWDEFVRIPDRIENGDTGDVADDFYHRYEEDIKIMQDLGIKSFRMSLSWARILPEGTVNNVNWAGVAFYNDVIDKLVQAGIQPFVTLYHWDLPSALMKDKSNDGWLNPHIQDYFNDYADFCFSVFGDRVKHWLTFNEPLSFTWLGYGIGLHAPGRCSEYRSADCSWVGDGGDTPTEPYITAHNVLLAHAKAVKTYREKYQREQGGLIGMTTQSDFGLPWDPSSLDDVDAVDTLMQFQFGWFNDPLVFGHYPDAMVSLISGDRLPSFTAEESELVKGSFDFLGLNHYTSKFVKHTGQEGVDYESDAQLLLTPYDVDGNLVGPFADSYWLNVYPEGFKGLLKWIDHRYAHLPIFVFENGVSVPGENEKQVQEAVKDEFRVDYYRDYIAKMQEAVEEGVDVRGYFAWSILDNFEWTDGYGVRFGMVYVDYENDEERHVKDSAYWYSDWIQSDKTQEELAW